MQSLAGVSRHAGVLAVALDEGYLGDEGEHDRQRAACGGAGLLLRLHQQRLLLLQSTLQTARFNRELLLLLLEGRRLSFHRAQFRGLTQQFGSQSFGIGVQLLVLQRVNEGAQLFLSLVQRAFVLLYFLL